VVKSCIYQEIFHFEDISAPLSNSNSLACIVMNAGDRSLHTTPITDPVSQIQLTLREDQEFVMSNVERLRRSGLRRGGGAAARKYSDVTTVVDSSAQDHDEKKPAALVFHKVRKNNGCKEVEVCWRLNFRVLL
jgi:hypothetical protein